MRAPVRRRGTDRARRRGAEGARSSEYHRIGVCGGRLARMLDVLVPSPHLLAPQRRSASCSIAATRSTMGPILPGLTCAPGIFFDERGRPDFRDVFGALAGSSVDIATAVTRVRLSTVDIT